MRVRWPWRQAAVTPALDCGDPDDGRPIYGCMACGMRRCHEHRSDGHLCRCPACLGFGEVLHVPCWPCDGTGKQWKETVA